MMKHISNDASLENLCPSVARAAAEYREKAALDMQKEALNSPLERARAMLDQLTARFISESPHAHALPDFIREIGSIRPTLLETIHQIAKSPEQVASAYQLDESSFERGWRKLLGLMESLDGALVAAETRASTVEHVGKLHTSLLDATMELNRIADRAERPAANLPQDTDDDGPITLEEARAAAQGTEPWDGPEGRGFKGI